MVLWPLWFMEEEGSEIEVTQQIQYWHTLVLSDLNFCEIVTSCFYVSVNRADQVCVAERETQVREALLVSVLLVERASVVCQGHLDDLHRQGTVVDAQSQDLR